MKGRWLAVTEVDHIAEALLIYEGVTLLARRTKIDVANGFPLISEVVWHTRRYRWGWVLPVGIVGWLAGHFAFGGRS